MTLPLGGVRVLDLSNVLAGPFCGYHLARLGAEVIKVENPKGGDLARRLGADPAMAEGLMGLSFVAVNAGKQSVAINLKSPEGKEILFRLVERSDALLENFRPGVMDRLGLGYEALKERNARLVYCAISGFGESGPWAARAAYDQIVQGLSGAMSVTGDAHTAPLRAGFPISDTFGGITAAFAIAAALVDQRQTGRGRRIDVSLLEATLAAMGWVVSNHLHANVTPAPMGNENFPAAVGPVRNGPGPRQRRAQQTKAVRDPLRPRRSLGAQDDPVVRRPADAQDAPGRPKGGARACTQGPPRGRMGARVQRGGGAVRLRSDGARDPQGNADHGARLRRDAGCGRDRRPAHARRAPGLPPRRPLSDARSAAAPRPSDRVLARRPGLRRGRDRSVARAGGDRVRPQADGRGDA